MTANKDACVLAGLHACSALCMLLWMFVVHANCTDHCHTPVFLEVQQQEEEAHPNATALVSTETQSTFVAIYETAYWGDDDVGGRSGHGSTHEQTRGVHRILLELQQELGFRSLLDVSCGSMEWMAHVLADMWRADHCLSFVGCDIVPALIDKHRVTYTLNRLMRFHVLDVSGPAFQTNADLLLCRDTLQHLPLAQVHRALRNMADSGARYLLLGGYHQNPRNVDIYTGDYQLFNPRAEPFLLDEERGLLREIREGPVARGWEKTLYLVDARRYAQSLREEQAGL